MTTKNRFSNALAIQQGACNPSGIAHSIVEACQEARDQGDFSGVLSLDPAIRLMAHQLAFICGVRQIDDELDEYGRLTAICKELAV